MTGTATGKLCPQGRLDEMVSLLRSNPQRGADSVDALLVTYPDYARLHFMKGSLLAGNQDFAAALRAMRRAVDLAPNYPIARFQLGLLLLTSGDAIAAQETWGPLHGLGRDNYLLLFVEGLTRLIHDDFPETIRLLEEGIRGNRENVPLNRNMQMVIDEVNEKTGGQGGGASSVDLLLQQAAIKATRH